MAIYTKTGDKGKTKVFNKKTGSLRQVSKTSKLINAIGATDELNSFLGLIGGLEEIQKNLFTINSIIAGAKITFNKNAVKDLEKDIDKWEGTLPVLKNFIIYSGTRKACEIYFARALCRRAERMLVNHNFENSRTEILAYVNRLSDYLFMLARFTNFKAKTKEKIWKI